MGGGGKTTGGIGGFFATESTESTEWGWRGLSASGFTGLEDEQDGLPSRIGYGTCLRGNDGAGTWIAAYAAMTGGRAGPGDVYMDGQDGQDGVDGPHPLAP